MAELIDYITDKQTFNVVFNALRNKPEGRRLKPLAYIRAAVARDPRYRQWGVTFNYEPANAFGCAAEIVLWCETDNDIKADPVLKLFREDLLSFNRSNMADGVRINLVKAALAKREKEGFPKADPNSKDKAWIPTREWGQAAELRKVQAALRGLANEWEEKALPLAQAAIKSAAKAGKIQGDAPGLSDDDKQLLARKLAALRQQSARNLGRAGTQGRFHWVSATHDDKDGIIAATARPNLEISDAIRDELLTLAKGVREATGQFATNRTQIGFKVTTGQVSPDELGKALAAMGVRGLKASVVDDLTDIASDLDTKVQKEMARLTKLKLEQLIFEDLFLAHATREFTGNEVGFARAVLENKDPKWIYDTYVAVGPQQVNLDSQAFITLNSIDSVDGWKTTNRPFRPAMTELNKTLKQIRTRFIETNNLTKVVTAKLKG